MILLIQRIEISTIRSISYESLMSLSNQALVAESVNPNRNVLLPSSPFEGRPRGMKIFSEYIHQIFIFFSEFRSCRND